MEIDPRPFATAPCSVATVLAIDGLAKRFGPAVALDGVSFTVAPGEVFGFVGGNVQNYESSSAGVNYAFAEFSRGTSSFRSKPRRQRIADKERFFEDIKAAEEAMGDKD